jgi:hypothetical protein
MTAFEWIKSSYSGTGETSTCVEVSLSEVAVRDSKAPEAGHLTFPAPAWSALLTALK